jgi:hypothetical protein
MTVDAGDGMSDELSCLEEWHLIELFESFHEIAVTQFRIRNDDRSVTVQAGARLFHDVGAFRVGLIFEHEGMAAFLAKILREGVTGPHDLETWIFLDA